MSSGEYSSTTAKCPYCSANYTYGPHQINDESMVSCQNCGKPFTVILSEGAGIAIPLGDDDILASERIVETFVSEALRVKCPHCMASYVYDESSRTPAGRFLCQNCGKSIEAKNAKKVEIIQTVSTDASNPGRWIYILAASVVLLLFAPWYLSIPAIACICLFNQHEEMSDRKVRVKPDQGLALD